MFIIFFIRCFFLIPLPSRTKLAPMTSRSRPENASSSIYSILYPHTASLASTSPLPWLLLPALFALLNYFAVFDYMPILPGAFCAAVSEWARPAVGRHIWVWAGLKVSFTGEWLFVFIWFVFLADDLFLSCPFVVLNNCSCCAILFITCSAAFVVWYVSICLCWHFI